MDFFPSLQPAAYALPNSIPDLNKNLFLQRLPQKMQTEPALEVPPQFQPESLPLLAQVVVAAVQVSVRVAALQQAPAFDVPGAISCFVQAFQFHQAHPWLLPRQGHRLE